MATYRVHTIAFQGSATTSSGTSYNTSTTPTAEIVIGQNKLVRIVPTTASVGVFVRFGSPGTNVATVADVYIPYGAFEVFDMGPASSICMFSTAAGTVQVTTVARS